MFILVQLPFADLRPMVSGQMGRLQFPDWTADDPGAAFVRGFGKMATRNSQGFGLFGERAFSDFNNAARLRQTLTYHQEGWPGSMQVELRFRRLYFDGKLAGRFEYGFIIDHHVEEQVSGRTNDFAYDIGRLSAQIQAIPLIIHSTDEREAPATVGTSGEVLGLAYIMATTKQSALSEYPPADTYGKMVAVGHPMIHMRVSEGKAVKPSRDRREIEGGTGRLFITSAEQAPIRNNVIVQMSGRGVVDESAQERALRVLFAHMNALLFAESHFLRASKELKLGTRSALAATVNDMLARFERFVPTGPMADNDIEFAAAIKAFAEAYKGRPEELVGKIEQLAAELAKPSTVRKVGTAVKGSIEWLVELAVKTSVQTGVGALLKGS
jgi:hypothetical protein